MNRSECLIFLKNQERTESILSLIEDHKTGMYHIRFWGSEEKEYSYKPDLLSPTFYNISYDGNPFTDLNAIYRYAEAGYWYLERGEKHYLISDSKLKITHSALENKNTSDVLEYLKEVSFVSPIQDEKGNRILSKRYGQICFVDDDSVLASYLSGNIGKSYFSAPSIVIYPFGTNKSQKKAVGNALSNKISIIQGPPGTGKTQTILTMIANLVLQGKTALIVSNNNSAVDNIKEKLETHGLSFLLASLGSAENKKEFIMSQTGAYPDISAWKLNVTEIREISSKVRIISNSLDEYYEIQEKKQKKSLELSELETEFNYFITSFPYGTEINKN